MDSTVLFGVAAVIGALASLITAAGAIWLASRTRPAERSNAAEILARKIADQLPGGDDE